MKKLPLLLLISSLSAILAPAWAETLIFTDTFFDGGSITNASSIPGGTPGASTTSYDLASTKDGRTCLIGAGKFRMKLGGNTTAGYLEAQAIFSGTPVQLVNVGDSINLTVAFTNSAGTLLVGGSGSLICAGLFYSGNPSVLPLGVSPWLVNAGLGSATTYASGYVQNWQGYVSQLSSNTLTSRILTRTNQIGADNGNQDLLFSGAGTGLYKNPSGTQIGTSFTGGPTLVSGAKYTLSYTILLSAPGTLAITNTLYDASGVSICSYGGVTSGGASYINNGNYFDGLAIGVANKGISYNPQMDISQITVTKHTIADAPALYNVQLNGFTNNTATGAAHVGSTGDLWNNPDWTGVYIGSTNLFTDAPLLTSSGANLGVTMTMTATYDNNTTDWNTGIFNHYTGQTSGSATPVLMDQVVKVDYSGSVNVMTLTVTGLPPNKLVTAYVYGAGNGAGQGSTWSLAAANGGGLVHVVYDGSATGRDVTLTSSKGISWEALSGMSDSSGVFTMTATGGNGSVWWQTYMNGLQLQIGGTAPTINGLVNQTVEDGTTVVLSPVVSGNPAPTYQWYENGTNIVGQTGPSLTLTNVITSQNGNVYSLVAQNPIGVASNSMTLTVNASVYSPMTVTAVSPANGATGVCYDTPLTVTFSDTVSLGTIGAIKIFNSANPATPVDTINASSGLIQQRTFPGDNQSFSYQTIQISGNTVKIYPHFNVLTSNQAYYVTIDPKTFKDSGGTNFVGLTSASVWQFTTKAGGAADTANIVVNGDGSADFLTVQGAVNSIPTGNITPTTINIRNGLYYEIVDISGKHNVTFRGQSRNGAVVFFPNNATYQAVNSGTTHARMSFKVNANDIVFDTLTISNSTPQGGSQAEALMVETGAKRCIVINSEIDSRQDTILANVNSSQAYFYKSLIKGNFDYIWGGGNLYFDQCEIRTIAGSSSFNVTAARTDTSATQSASFPWVNPGGTYTANGMSFVNCTFTAEAGVGAVTLAGSNGTAGNNVSWSGCEFATNYVAPSASLFSGNFVFWQSANTTNGIPVTFPVLTTIGGSDPQLLAATNILSWFYSWNPQLAPSIATPPASQSVNADQPVSFAVSATAIPDPSYQWLKNGTNLDGQTAATLAITNANGFDIGDYSVVVANGVGSVTSSVAHLTVIAPTVSPTLDTAVVLNSGNVQFNITGAPGAAGFGYRVWATTDLSLPASDWTMLTNDVFGTVPTIFTDSTAAGLPQRFYIITVP